MRLLIALCVLLVAASANAQPVSVVGTWEGDSVCQVPKPCTTEHVIYEFTAKPDGTLNWKADKVVNGQREWMGRDFTCTWSNAEQRLSCPMEGRRPGDWVLWLKGDQLIGVLTIREGNLIYRKISVKRKP